MANGQIDVIVAKKAVEELNTAIKGVDAINNSIITLSKSVRELNTTFSQIKTPQGLEERLKKNEKAQKDLNIEAKESERLNKSLIISRERLKTVTSAENLELQRNRQRLNEANRAVRTLDSAYAKLSKRTLDAKKRAKDLGAEFGLTSKQFKKAQKEAQKLDRRIKKLDKAVGDSQRNVGNYPKVFGSATSAMKGFIGAFGIIEGLRLGARFIKDLADLAKQMEGDSRRAAIVFGENLAFVTKEAEENAIALGLTRREYVAAAAATQDLLIPLGFQREEASKLSIELTNLSGVLSNWVGGQKDAREVSEILTKSILGETEQIKTLGIKIDQSSPAFNRRVKQLEETNDLTREQAKALEILNQITTKSADAQAEFANETKSLALQEAEANALFREQSEILANDLTPAYIGWINAKRQLAGITGDLFVLFGSELNFFEKLGRLVELGTLSGITRNAVEAMFIRLENERLAVAEQAFKILVKTTDEEAARTLVNNLTIDQLRELIAAQKKLNDGLSKEELINKIISKSRRGRFNAFELEKKSVEELKRIFEKLNDVNEDSIKFLEEIIKKNKALIKTTDDNTYRRRLLQENLLLAEQIKLLTKVPQAVKAINAVSVGIVTQEEKERRRKAGKREGTALAGGTTREGALPDFIEGLTPTLFPTEGPSAFETAIEDVTDFVDIYGEQIDKAIGITNAFFDNRIDRIQRDIDASNAFFENQIALAEGNEAQQQRLEQERQTKEAELKKKQQKELNKQAIINKAMAVATTAINTAQAIVAALAPPPIGLGPVLGIPLAISTGVLGAAQLALIAATPIPKFAEGTASAPKGLGVVGDAGVHEYIETDKGIFKTPDTDTLVSFRGREKVHKDLDSLVSSKGYDLDAINKAAVMTSIVNDGLKLSSIQLTDSFNKALDKYHGRIQKEIKNGLKNIKNINNNITNFDHSIYKNEVL
jgi:hypothetical protein